MYKYIYTYTYKYIYIYIYIYAYIYIYYIIYINNSRNLWCSDAADKIIYQWQRHSSYD